LNEKKTSRETDLDRLGRLKVLSWLSPSELKLLASALSLSNYKRHALILRDVALAQGAHILISGIARITCRSPRQKSFGKKRRRTCGPASYGESLGAFVPGMSAITTLSIYPPASSRKRKKLTIEREFPKLDSACITTIARSSPFDSLRIAPRPEWIRRQALVAYT